MRGAWDAPAGLPLASLPASAIQASTQGGRPRLLPGPQPLAAVVLLEIEARDLGGGLAPAAGPVPVVPPPVTPDPNPPPPVVPVRQPVQITVGSGPDALVLAIAQDYVQADAQYVVRVDGVQIGGTLTASALQSSGQTDTLTVLGNWPAGQRTVLVQLLNPASGRALYLRGATYDDADALPVVLSAATATLTTTTPHQLAFTAVDPVPSTPPPGPNAPVAYSFGTGPDVLTIRIAQDYYLANAEYTVAVDGTGYGGTLQASAIRSAGTQDTVTIRGDWSAGSHLVSVHFLNDAYGGTPDTDRNLHVMGITFVHGDTPGTTVNVVSAPVAMLSAGSQAFSFSVGGVAPGPVPQPSGRVAQGLWVSGNNHGDVLAFEQWLGRQVDFVHCMTDGSRGWDGLHPQNRISMAGDNPRRRAFWSAMFVPDGSPISVWQEVANGQHDGRFHTWADYMVNFAPADGSDVWVRTTWEAPGEWFEWGRMARDNPEQFKASWRTFARAMKSRSPRIKMVWDFNSDRSDPRLIYPGDDVVDIISQDIYWDRDLQGTDPHAAWERHSNGYTYGLNWMANFAAERGKPVSISEWASHGDDSGPWFDHMRDWILSHNVAYVCFWAGRSKAGDGYEAWYPGGAYETAGVRLRALWADIAARA